MVVSPLITFQCPYCGIMLTVPMQQAGVDGPCPQCAQAIHAPLPQSNPRFAYPYPGFPSMGPIARPTPAPTPAPADTPAASKKPITPASVPIAPRSAPVPSAPRQVVSENKEKPAPSGHREILPKRRHETRRMPKRILLRSIIPLLFAGATAVLILGVVQVFKKQGILPAPISSVASSAKVGKQPENKKSGTAGNTSVPATVPSRSGTGESPQHPGMEETVPRPAAATEALAVLENFLKASSLEERLPIIETKEPEGALTDSILAGPLPSFRNLVIDSQKSFPLENIVDFYFTFEFINKDASAYPQTVVVRRRGSMNPRVLADPFLDLYGGRLAAYAAKPQSKGRVFHAIVYALPSCNDLKIPDRQKKITLRLYSHEHSPNVTLAYASRVSKIGELLTSGNHDLTYGKPKDCVVLLGWNTEESPGAPYLEALDISAFHWNP